MTDLEAALVEVTSVLERLSIPYMLIGGLAVSSWGEARSTLDVDVTIWIEPEQLDRTVSEISKQLQVVPKDPAAYSSFTRAEFTSDPDRYYLCGACRREAHPAASATEADCWKGYYGCLC